MKKQIFLLASLIALVGQGQNIIKLTKGKVEVYDSKGSYKTTIADGIISASSNNEYVFVVTQEEVVEQYEMNGKFVRKVTREARSVQATDEQVAITLNNGDIEIYDMKGKYVRKL